MQQACRVRGISGPPPSLSSSPHFIQFGSSGGSLVATPDCKLQSWVQIHQSPQPTVDCQSLDGLPSGMALFCRLSSEGRQRSIYIKHKKTIKEKKTFYKVELLVITKPGIFVDGAILAISTVVTACYSQQDLLKRLNCFADNFAFLILDSVLRRHILHIA